MLQGAGCGLEIPGFGTAFSIPSLARLWGEQAGFRWNGVLDAGDELVDEESVLTAAWQVVAEGELDRLTDGGGRRILGVLGWIPS